MIMFSCGNEKQNKEKKTLENTKVSLETKLPKKNNDSGSACEILTENFVKSIFSEAINFKPKSSEKPYPTCSYKFEVNGSPHHARLTIAKGFGSEKNLEMAMKYHAEKELVSGVGQKAYYLIKSHQLSVWEGKNIFHVNINGNKEKSIEAAKEIIELL